MTAHNRKDALNKKLLGAWLSIGLLAAPASSETFTMNDTFLSKEDTYLIMVNPFFTTIQYSSDINEYLGRYEFSFQGQTYSGVIRTHIYDGDRFVSYDLRFINESFVGRLYEPDMATIVYQYNLPSPGTAVLGLSGLFILAKRKRIR